MSRIHGKKNTIFNEHPVRLHYPHMRKVRGKSSENEMISQQIMHKERSGSDLFFRAYIREAQNQSFTILGQC